MNTKRKAEDIATDRRMLIAPLLDQSIDSAKERALIKEIAEKNNISIRSIGRYLDAYKDEGFKALMQKEKPRNNFKSMLPSNWTDIVNEAILLRRELPSRSVPQIIKILELEQFAKPGEIKNWLFSDTKRGAVASATVYSIIETAKLNGLNPYMYLVHLLTQLPNLKELTNETLKYLLFRVFQLIFKKNISNV